MRNSSSYRVNSIYLRAGVTLDYETKSSYAVTVEVDDPTIGSGAETSVTLTLLVNNLEEYSVVGNWTATLDEDFGLHLLDRRFPLFRSGRHPVRWSAWSSHAQFREATSGTIRPEATGPTPRRSRASP